MQVFRGGWDPERFELDGFTQVTVGRVPEAELRVLHHTLGRRHMRLERRDRNWWLEDMGSTNGTAVNGTLIRQPWRLEHEDLVSVIDFAFTFETRDEQRNPELEATILARPGDPAAVAVWADWLLEHGDLLGERLAHAARGGPVHPVMTGGFQGTQYVWHCDLGFEHGLLESVAVRSHGQDTPVKMLLSRLCRLRSARFLRRLRVDLAGLASEDLLSELDPLLDRLPKSLEVLDLGYMLDRPDLVLTDAQAAKLPRLRERTVQQGRACARLIAGTVTFDVTAELSIDVRDGRASVSRRGPAGQNGWPADDQAIFRPFHGGWSLIVALPVQDHLKVNGYRSHAHGLMPRDRIEVGQTVFRFELD